MNSCISDVHDADKRLKDSHEKEEKLSLLKNAKRPILKLIGTDIGVNFDQLDRKHIDILTVNEDIFIMFNGMYRNIILNKLNSEHISLEWNNF